MTEHESSRTLVKSAPELWAECSDAASLARHLGAFGEIRITKLEPETAVAWEGAAASGTVKLETSGWGTRVTLTVKEGQAPTASAEPLPEPVVEAVQEPEPEPEPEPVAVAEPEPVAVAEPDAPEAPEPEELVEPEPRMAEPPLRIGVFARFRGAFRRKPGAAAVVEPELIAMPEPGPEPIPAAEAPPEPEPVTEPAPEPAPAPEPPRLTGEDALVAALDSLGMAHHRPYSRS
jgi:outer membrane biosynthesis protein TonB